MKRKYDIEFLKNSMENEGYMLVSIEYSSTKKLEYICNKGHKSSMTACNWIGGKRCPICKSIKIGDIKRLDFDVVKNSFRIEDFILLSTDFDYKNNETKLKYICPNGHEHSIRWTKWQQHRRCPSCAKNSKVYYIEVKKSFEDAGYTLLSKEYNYNTKLEYTCNYGHKHSISWGHWQQGRRCPVCAIVKKSGSRHHAWQGGISFEPYCEVWQDKEYKQSVRERDGNRCLNPYCFKDCNTLSIHHIDYNKKHCHPSNLITVCRSCNSRANKDREWHKSWYQAIIKNRYYSRSPK